MTGYDYEMGMSNGALDAYEEGRKPISKLTKQDFMEVGLNVSAAFAKWLAKKRHWRTSEWHHSGGDYFNKVYFYDPQQLADLVAGNVLDLEVLEAEYKASKNKKAEEVPVFGVYDVFGGSRQHPKIVDRVEFTGKKIGDWIYLDNGSKKKASGNYITWNIIGEKVSGNRARKLKI
jgi:hypothetical protein